MPVIQISTFEIADEAKATEILEAITQTMHAVTGIPLDKISVYLQEIRPARWADAGVPGSASDFATKSRRKSYEEIH